MKRAAIQAPVKTAERLKSRRKKRVSDFIFPLSLKVFHRLVGPFTHDPRLYPYDTSKVIFSPAECQLSRHPILRHFMPDLRAGS